jgi:hypothetical protein
MPDTREQVQEIARAASPEARQVITEVLRVERDKLHLKLPRGIVQDITDIVKKIVK